MTHPYSNMVISRMVVSNQSAMCPNIPEIVGLFAKHYIVVEHHLKIYTNLNHVAFFDNELYVNNESVLVPIYHNHDLRPFTIKKINKD